MITAEYLIALGIAVINTAKYYFIAWVFGTVFGLVTAYFSWRVSRGSHLLYIMLTGASFVPVSLLLPFFVRTVGPPHFIFPLLIIPAFLATYATCHESFALTNRHRAMLVRNFAMKKHAFFRRIVLRESLPTLVSTARQTLALSFAIFLALDYFVEMWGGLGALVQKKYHLSGWSTDSFVQMNLTILAAVALGGLQAYALRASTASLTAFRKHY